MKCLFALLFLQLLCSSCDTSVSPVLNRGGPLTLSRDSISLTVDPQLGGRIISLKYGDREVLNTVRDSSGFTYGSTAWPSPQANWKWPPPAAIDSEPYTVQKVEEHSILLISKEMENGLVLQKRFRLGPDQDIGLTYWLTYNGDSVMSVAPWEITRLPYAGRIDFTADSVRTELTDAEVVDSRDSLRTIVFDDRQPAKAKVYANLDTVPVTFTYDGLQFEKHTIVTDYYRVAPGQAPLEIYLEPARNFVEFELQGDYRELRYGETATLRTKWRLIAAE